MHDILHEFLHNTLHLDGKFFKMLNMLFQPGRLTVDFFKGRQKRYPHPTRFFLVIVGVFLLLFSKSIDINVNDEDNLTTFDKAKKYVEFDEFHNKLISVTKESQTDILQNALDSAKIKYGINPERDSFEVGFFDRQNKVSSVDLVKLSADSILIKYEIKGFWNKKFIKQSIRAIKDPTSITKSWLSTISFTIILILGFGSGVLLLLFRKNRTYFVEHFVFLMHHTSALLLGMSVFLLLGNLPVVGWFFKNLIVLWWFLWMTAGMIFSMRQFYKEKWGMILVKWVFFSIFYALLCFFGLILSFVFSMFFLI
jgi:hypothetical protein